MARLSDAELLAWMTNFINVASVNPAEYGLTAAQIAEMTTFRDSLQAIMNKRDGSEAVFRADVIGQQSVRSSIDPFVSFLIAMLKKNPAVSETKKAEIGVMPDKPPTSTPPVTPASIIANGYENGINVIRWERTHNKPSTQFILEYREVAETEFKYLATVTDTVYNHTGVNPGTQYAYRVKAQRAGMESAYSNVAVVYMT